MKQLDIYQKLGLQNADAVFRYLIQHLAPTVNNWSYLVDWKKADNNVRTIEVNLNLLNYLLGKDNIEDEFAQLIIEYPNVRTVLPILVACRDTKFTIMTEFDDNDVSYAEFDFRSMSVEQAVEFARGSGILNLLKGNKIKNLVDYVFGIEVGLGSNGRKNRSGTAMENMMEFHINHLCKSIDAEYLAYASSAKVRREWGIDLAVDKADREIDFIIKRDDLLYLIEVNYYSGVGSKLKATAGEYKGVFDFWKKHNYRFLWITDGFGWNSTQKPLREAFDKLDYILNIKMVYDGVLKDIIENKL